MLRCCATKKEKQPAIINPIYQPNDQPNHHRPAPASGEEGVRHQVIVVDGDRAVVVDDERGALGRQVISPVDLSGLSNVLIG